MDNELAIRDAIEKRSIQILNIDDSFQPCLNIIKGEFPGIDRFVVIESIVNAIVEIEFKRMDNNIL